ncbi:MAG: PucR family transcriptional regulator, partial [Limosilactobacillus sp.]
IVSNDSAMAVVNRLQDILIGYLNWEEELSRAISYKDPVGRVVSVLQEKVSNPLMVFDDSFKLLAFNKRVSTDWLASIQRGYISFSNENSAAFRRQLNSDENIQGNVVHLRELQDDFYVRKVILRNNDCFYLMIDLQDTDKTALDQQLVEAEIDKVAAAVGLHNFPYLTQSANLEGVLRDLLSRPDISHTELQNRLQFDPHQLQRPLAALCIPSRQRRNQIIGTILTKFVTFHYDKYDVYVVENYSKVIEKTIKQELSSYLRANNLTAGISNRFDKLHLFNRYYLQATKAVQFSKKDEYFSVYSDHIGEVLIAHIKEDNSLKGFLDPAIVKLKEDDSKLFETLLALLSLQENKKGTAARLGIHRSTLDYRINKIEKDYGIDVTNADHYVYHLLTALLLD